MLPLFQGGAPRRGLLGGGQPWHPNPAPPTVERTGSKTYGEGESSLVIRCQRAELGLLCEQGIAGKSVGDARPVGTRPLWFHAGFLNLNPLNWTDFNSQDSRSRPDGWGILGVGVRPGGEALPCTGGAVARAPDGPQRSVSMGTAPPRRGTKNGLPRRRSFRRKGVA